MLDRFPNGNLTPNLGHPLNRGRVAWWLVTPQTSGGGKFVDLMGRNHGTLTNMTSTGGWRGTTRSGGWGHLLFDGTDDSVRRAGWSDPGGPATFAISCNCSTLPSTYARAAISLGTDTSAGSLWIYFWSVGLGQKIIGGVFSGSKAEIQGPVYALNTWYRVVVTWTGSVVSLYVNGELSSFASATGTRQSSGLTLFLGNESSSAYAFAGGMDDAGVWSRALSAAEVAEDYRLSRLGYPGVLNRVGRAVFGGTTSIIPQAMTYYRRRRTG